MKETSQDFEPYNPEDDDFICFMRTDGGTIASKNGVTVKVDKIGTTPDKNATDRDDS
ncbi:hypothetical protein [Alkalimarinus alittae]|uniref:Uncharacterized protein n=1 Tax=Alkalimarinus alittae TaxID=2961619 RepID=A0ABY6N199_9ALTE|nr:hypothetical protein [Alkalimarinus alittae]UZE95888.1 hypothetical protein NKI27_17855 [Alkalimarinus alittae]